MVRPIVGEYPALVTYPTHRSPTNTASLPSATAVGSSKTMLRNSFCGVVRPFQRLLADELVFVHPDGEVHTRCRRLVLCGHVRTPEPVSLFDAQAVERDPPGGDHVVRLTRLEEQIPQRGTVFGAGVDLPTELSDIRDPQHRDRDRVEVGLQRAEVLELLVRQVVGAQRCHHVAGQRPPDADAAGAAGDVAQGDVTG